MNAPAEDALVDPRQLERCPFPMPIGWFYVDHSENLKVGEVRNVFILDQEWVLFRGEGGKVGMSDPYCPHLGAHLGHGGKVVGDNIRCTFHHWQFDSAGWCRDVPYGERTPPITKIKPILRTLPVIEKWGMIWAWYHPDGTAPLWEMPSIPELESDEYEKPRLGSWPVNTAIQEIAENGVDFAHLRFLHGNPEIPHAEWRFEDHNYYADMNHGYLVTHQSGPGLVVARFTTQGITSTMISYTQPITREKSMMRMSFTHKKYADGSPEHKVAKHLVDHMIGDAEGEQSAGFESVDFVVWNHKKYRAKPLLCDGDGPITQYRAWFRQFYPEGTDFSKI
ncbi:MAG: Rieske (2Fe-2S) protein [Proteobacteria bacterium]|nr:Rieske (2Fe-2S) protein [Pseudomonadota bacterium]HQR04641.1 Rieske 2Fe-2S domain-containing protein [Rhodocyclaceae bacterium]